MNKNSKIKQEEKNLLDNLLKYVKDRFGSLTAFLVLKHILEHKLARDNNGLATFELTYNIPPSSIITPKTLVKIVSRANREAQQEIEKGFNLLLKNGIVKVDPDINMIELSTSIDKITNIYLKKINNNFEEVVDYSEADAILFSTLVKDFPTTKKDKEFSSIAGVLDIMLKDEHGKVSPVLLKYF